MKEELSTITNTEWKRNTLIIGTVMGILVGAVAAFMYVQQHDKENGKAPEFSIGDGVKLGVMVLGMMRGIAAL
jgi:hypothetical protein